MKPIVTMWINFILSGLWLLIAIIRLLESAPIVVTILSFAAFVLFLVLGICHAYQIKQQKNQR